MQTVNKLILGDNLEILKQLPGESIDLIYLDPPFFSNRNYEIIWGDEGEVRSFKDRWSGGMDHYIAWLKERVEQMHRVLKSNGSIFLHCDWHANAYIRTDILDKLFAPNNFRNEIIWQRTRSAKKQSSYFSKTHDTIYFYTKSANSFFKPLFLPHREEYIKSHYYNIESETNRRYTLDNFTQAGQGEPRNFGGKLLPPPPGKHWIWTQERIDEGLSKGIIVFTSSGMPRLKRYLDETKGEAVQDIWTDIPEVNSQANERIGYPTQKPQALIRRIIEAGSNEGDTIMDPFVGGGTTVAVADKLNRRWIGIDQSVQAIKVTEFRLNQQQDLFSQPFILQLHKYDYDTLRNKNAFAFEAWIVEQYGGTGNIKQRSDLGLDGKTKEGVPIQVKRSEHVGRNVIDNFLSAVKRFDKNLFDKNHNEGKPVGYIIAFSFAKGAVEEVARLKNKENVIVKLVEVEDIIPISKKPALTVEVNELPRDKKNIREIELIAKGSSAAGIEFYSWDWDYDPQKGFKPEVIRDVDGKQIQKFKPGQHNIAVKVVDNDGLDNIEVIKLKVNGEIERT
jgi:DNA modification methylase